jgi:hypothetical protein
MAGDFEHTGDGRTPASVTEPRPYLFVSYGEAVETYLVRKGWVGPRYSGGTARTLDTVGNTTTDPIAGVFDGSQYITAFINDASDTVIQWHERDAADTTPTERTPTALSDGAVTNLAIQRDASNDTRLYAVGTTSDDVKRLIYDRSEGTFDTWTTIEATTAVANSLSCQAGYTGSGISLVWTSGSGSPYDIVYEKDSFNTAPTEATWVSPLNNSAADVAATLALDWDFNDPDAGDTQSAYALKRSVDGGAAEYYNAGAGTWGTETKNTSTTSGVTLATAWATDGEVHVFDVKTYDAGDVSSPWTTDGPSVTGSTKVNPTLTAPATSATLTGSSATMTWTVTGNETTAFRARILTSADVVLYDSGKIVSTALSYVVPYTLTNGLADLKFEVRTWNNEGLESSTSTSTLVDVTYTAPLTPTYVITPNSGGYIAVAITDPTPSGTPTVTSHDVFVRVASGGRQDLDRTVNDDGIRIATGIAEDGTYNDYAAASGVAYEYRTLAYGDNGGTVYGAWTGEV